MTFATDVHEQTSEALSAVIQKVLDDDEIVQPATLASVREKVLEGVKTATIPLNRFSDDQLQELRDEIDYLIEEHGGDGLAVHFFKSGASQALTQIIDEAIGMLDEPSLGQLFNEIENGLLADQIAKGEIDDDEAQTVIAELQALIDKHGPDEKAEDFVQYL